ncbi:hypothetical protein NDU88_004823 [Pleurodeles waltl]|uniref:Uncharacterized protein n=1 Tax=Pleurodeles waltl TaxID=8319 RepID=A0AAV7TUS9_PLEWA|nr:hypothetical protein NDU88_004823 [Pleurodeles waltl]
MHPGTGFGVSSLISQVSLNPVAWEARDPRLGIPFPLRATKQKQQVMDGMLNIVKHSPFQETQRLQEEHYLGIREKLKSINTTLVTIVGVLQDLVNIGTDRVAQQGAPDTSLDDEQPTTSAGVSEQGALPQDHDTSTPPPADGEPPRKRSLRSRNKTENIAKTPASK